MFRQLLAEMIHTAAALQHRAVRQVQPQGPAQHLAVFQLVQLHPGDATFAAEDQAHTAAFGTFRDHGVQQAEKTLLPDGLELVEIGPHGVGLHGEFRRGGKENNFHALVIPADLPGGIDPVLPRHHHIQQQNIKAGPPLNLCQQLQRTLKGRGCNFHVPFHPVAVQQHPQLTQYGQIIVAKANLYHERSPFRSVLVSLDIL